MIPTDWLPYRRDEDGELLGYLIPQPGEEEFVPVTVFGYPLGGAEDIGAAASVLDSIGLDYLADRWLLTRAGRELPVDTIIVEAGPDRLVVQSVDYSTGAGYGTRYVLEVPEPGNLRRA